MVNARLIELMKNPSQLAAEDLALIKNNVAQFPYAQSLRALDLLAVNRFQPENYQQKLSETAAYTTDKKILFNWINGVQNIENQKFISENDFNEDKKPLTETIIEKSSKESPSSEIILNKNLAVVNKFNAENIPQIEVAELPRPVYVNGELNRILFEGEEDFLDRPNVGIDMESTLESGKIVVAEPEILALKDKENTTIEESGTPEVIVDETENEPKIVEDTSILSFHGTEDFLPSVKIAAPSQTQTIVEPPKPANRHEDEMERLIAEVEAKMKASKKEKPQSVTDEPVSSEINFAESIPFEVEKPQTDKGQVDEAPVNDWKPMGFTPNIPDASIVKTESVVEPISEIADVDIEEKHTKTEQQSNVSQFINTWQNWLKLDKAPQPENGTEPEISVETVEKILEEIIEEEKIAEVQPEVTKEAAIEKFIETEPKISRLKEEGNYIYRDKNDDISHLMTETLANLYVEQRLYAKAISGFEILKKKHPEKAKYYSTKIRELREFKSSK